MCFLARGRHITRNMCFLGRGKTYHQAYVGGGEGKKKCALHHGGVDFFWNNPLRSYNLGQKCEGKWSLPCLVSR